MLNVQQFLVDNSVEELVKQYNIKVRDYPEDNILMLNYDMIDSPKTHPITMECRSLILDRTNYNIISKKFDRFFNLGENPESYLDFDWDNCYITEKVDGSLTGVYYNPNTARFEISSRSQAKAELDHEVFGNWREVIISTFGFNSEEEFQEFFNEIRNSKDITFIFEFISPLNRIVTPYSEPKMVFLGGTFTDNEPLSKYDMGFFMENYFNKINVRLPEFYDIPHDTDALIKLANTLPNLQEGFVLWDEHTNKRIKLKSTAYLVAHRMRGEDSKPTRKNILNLIFTGEVDEFLVYFPEYKEFFDKENDNINDLNQNLNSLWQSVKHIEDQKEFALKIKDNDLSSILFMAKKQGIHPIQVFHNLPADKKIRYFNV